MVEHARQGVGEYGVILAMMALDGFSEEVTFGKTLEDFKYGNTII